MHAYCVLSKKTKQKYNYNKMQNKGIVIVTAVLLALASIFYLSFSVATSYYDSKASEIEDPIAQQDYKD